MRITRQLLHQIADPTLTGEERVLLRCRVAKELIEVGNYDAARDAMTEVWPDFWSRPASDGLSETATAEVLLRVGVLAGWIGSVRQIEDSQEMAKSFITESITRFEALRIGEKVAEAQMELGPCYWREGAFDEARVWLNAALGRAPDGAKELRAIILSRLATVEWSAKRLTDAYHLLTIASPMVDEISSDTVKGKFHNQFATVLENLSRASGRRDYTDRALIEYAAASYHFEQAGHARYQACVENNLGFLFGSIEKFQEAHEHLDRAQALFTAMKDEVHTAQVDDTRAKVLLAEGRVAEAEKLVRSAVAILEKGGEQSLLSEALTTHGVSLARMGKHELARLTLQRAVEVAQTAGDTESAGLSSLTIVEELGEQMEADDIIATYRRAADLLSNSRNQESRERLIDCSQRVLHHLGAPVAPPSWEGFNLQEAVLRYEARLIEWALKEAGGVVARAARLLGVGRQTLDNMLQRGRHQSLSHLRGPVAPRRYSLMFRDNEDCPDHRSVMVLHVEDDRFTAKAVREKLEYEGWAVETCRTAAEALETIESGERFDVTIFDYRLPDAEAVELIHRVRSLAHRESTPIIVLTCDDETEIPAKRAGANAFLVKPEGVEVLTETIARLLARRSRRL